MAKYTLSIRKSMTVDIEVEGENEDAAIDAFEKLKAAGLKILFKKDFIGFVDYEWAVCDEMGNEVVEWQDM